MKLCFLAAANSIHSKKWIQFFADKGHEVHWISLTPNCWGDIKKLNFHSMNKIPGKSLNSLVNVIPIRNLVRRISPDILHVHYAGTNGMIGAFSGFHPFVLTAWGTDVLVTAKSRLKGFLVKFALGKADLITCDAEHMSKAIKELRVPPARIRIVHFGVDTQKFCPGPRDERIERKLGVSGCKTVISLRSFETIYDIETLIRAIPPILQEAPMTRFVIAGNGSQEERLKQLAKNLGIYQEIRFVGGIPNDVLPQYLRIADVYVSTSLSDAGIAASTAEAMSCGLPVIVTNTGENENWVKDGENGYLVPTKNPSALAAMVIDLLRNPNLKERFRLNNRRIIEQRNDYYREMAKMETLYRELIRKKNAG